MNNVCERGDGQAELCAVSSSPEPILNVPPPVPGGGKG